MKSTINAEELRSLDACEEGLNTFVDAHGVKTVTLSGALTSNGWNDIWWLIGNIYSDLSQDQKNDLDLIGCDWAEKCLINFESEFPDDKRPRDAIQAKRDFVAGKISKEDLSAAESAAWSAAESARSAARSAAESARSSRSAAESARSARSARSAAESAESETMKEMTNELSELFKRWES